MIPGELEARFVERFHSPPDGVWRAPGRVNLIGEHTDYNDGFVLPFAIQLETRAAARRREDGVIECHSLEMGAAPPARVDDLSPDASRGWWSYVHGVVAGVGDAVGGVGGADILVTSTIPRGAGLSSSAALECAIAVAIRDLTEAHLSPRDLALIAQRAEIEFAGVPCGVMDQLASMSGQEGHALFIDTRSLDIEPVAFPPEGYEALVVDTGVAHELAEGAYAERRAACERAARLLGAAALRDVAPAQLEVARGGLDAVAYRRARHVVTENERVIASVEALRRGDIAALSATMRASHDSLRHDFEVSTPELDLAVEAALDAGAAGARMTGGGFGGAAIALVAAADVSEIESSVRRAFRARDLREPAVRVVHAAPGASRLS